MMRQYHNNMMRCLGCLLVTLWIPLVGCTDADLVALFADDPPYARASLQATLCPPDTIVEPVPYKVLFVIDTSGSTAVSDPTPPTGYSRRETAVRSAISEHSENVNVSFGIITFASQPRRQTFGFTRDLATLNDAAANIATAHGGTNYSDTLWAAIDFILNDVEQTTAAESAMTHYIIHWLSDGEPTVGVLTANSIVPGAVYLRDTLASQVASFEFNTAFLGGYSDDIALTAIATDLLIDMAAAGDGMFANIVDGDVISFEVHPMPRIRRYMLASVMVSNRHALFGVHHPLPDSDADGLTDAEEESLGTDPFAIDTDGDGIRDSIEVTLSSQLHPLFPNDICPSEPEDLDGDGLTGCEEVLLGTSDTRADSDGDMVSDETEFRMGGMPLDPGATSDMDLDNMSDETELRLHLDPRQPTTDEDIERWAYVYELSVEESDDETRQEGLCSNLSVENIGVFETGAVSSTGLQGANQLEVFAAFVPEDGAPPTVYMRATVDVVSQGIDTIIPADGGVTLHADDFRPLN